jgi:hypothetical protein
MTKFPVITIHGPSIPGSAGDSFWQLDAAAPEFGLGNVEPKEQGRLEDRVHPLRVLHLDPYVTKLGKEQWRLPRTMSAHVITGALVNQYGRWSSEELHVRIPAESKTIDTKSWNDDDPLFRTFDPDKPERAGFQHVVLETLADDLEEWPGDKNIEVPPFRLVAGAIELLARHDQLEWLHQLNPVTRLVEGRLWVRLLLTPDGIELEGNAPFPSQGKKKGRFLLAPGPAKTLRLHLLPARLEPALRDDWNQAWASVTPSDVEQGTGVTGLKMAARRAEVPPAFIWTLKSKDRKITGFEPEVEVPATDLAVRFLSPKGPNGIDGEVTLAPDSWRFSAFAVSRVPGAVEGVVRKKWIDTEKPAVMFVAEMTPRTKAKSTNNPTRLVLDGGRNLLKVDLVGTDEEQSGHPCAHDEVELAASLRRAYGLDELLPGLPDRDRPLLPAFVPLDDGWLQLPVPNVPPSDPARDTDSLPIVAAPGNVLSGYLRFAQSGSLPPVLSAFPDSTGKKTELKIDEAPWIITIEGAEEVAVAIGVATDGMTATLLRFAAALERPELSTRGLLWVSADRPDALEALPRLGAGAGAYFDVPLETYDVEAKLAMQFAIRKLAINVTRAAPFDTLSRDLLELSSAFNADESSTWTKIVQEPDPATGKLVTSTRAQKALDAARVVLSKDAPAASPNNILLPLPPVLWQRHVRMPLAAAMPMTRGAGSAVRPLESRDFVPFVFDIEKKSPVAFVTLTSEAGKVFPAVTQQPMRPVASWPWPQAKEDPMRQQGIAFVAFGVPGAEVALSKEQGSSKTPWTELRAALRFDLPALDEAFATAQLPPQPPETALPEERDVPPPDPVPVAHDWPAISRFWSEQNRKHQIARVAHSYLGPYAKTGTDLGKVKELVGGTEWVTSLAFNEAKDGDALPYGAAKIDGEELSGNAALLGVSKDVPLLASHPPVPVTGYAPASFIEKVGGEDFLMDARRSGIQQARLSTNGKMYLRRVAIRVAHDDEDAAKIDTLATLLAPVPVGTLFHFWLKDLPLNKNGVFVPAPAGTDFAVWQDGHLPRSGYEWRLIPAADDLKVFRRGRDRIAFFGFELEPLRLEACEIDIAGEKVKSAKILARLHLGPLGDGPQPDANLVDVTLGPKGNALQITAIKARGTLRFGLRATKGIDGRAVVTTSDADWKNDKLVFGEKTAGLTVTLFGEDRTLPASITAAAGKVTIERNASPAVSVAPGEGRLVIDGIKVVVTDNEVELSLKSRILLTPRASAQFESPTSPAALSVELKGNDVVNASLIGLDLKSSSIAFEPRDGAFALLASKADYSGAILSCFNIEGSLALGLVARVRPIDEKKFDGVFDLTAGYLDGLIVAADPTAAVRRVSFTAECGRREERGGKPATKVWIGDIRLHGTLAIGNAIRWPGIADSDKLEDIPWPDDRKPRDGRTDVRVVKDAFHRHTVTYTLDDHALPFDVAARVHGGSVDTVWAVPVIAEHVLEDKAKKTRTFVSVETIAIGSAEAIVPKVKDTDAKADPVTFAARHPEGVVDGEEQKPVPGMLRAGVGRIATVLRGALGYPFREAFWRGGKTHKGLFLAGGFAGLIASNDGDRAPLVRLPVLAAFDGGEDLSKPGFITQDGELRPIGVAWADGRAARHLVATLRNAVAPASTSDSALRAALLAGSRAAASAGLTPEQTIAAVLVEQSFAVRPADGSVEVQLASEPFFLAAAVSLARALARFPENVPPAVLSLLAGSSIAKTTRTFASAVITRTLPAASDPLRVRELRAELATIGNDVVVRPWQGPAVAALESIVPVALVATPAFADHARPRAALLRTSSEGQVRFDAPPLPLGREKARLIPPVNDRDFADKARGYGLLPEGDPLRWLAGPEQGRMQPFRDDKSESASGLAGLSRAMAMPAHAATLQVEDQTIDPARRNLVWFSQTRAPVYLPLPLSLKSSPIPWLTPAQPRPRVPSDDALAVAFDKLGFPLDEKKSRVVGAQPVLPDSATLASVGDRAGILLARIARFETSVGPVASFDRRNERFGRPGQGGSWSVRTERTPRPAALPENRGDAERDRRPAASRLLAKVPLHALIGPADTVAGEPANAVGAWTVTMVAAADWNGMVTESWDGTIRIDAEIDVASLDGDANPPVDAVAMLFRLLFPGVVKNDFRNLQTRASLVIGEVVVPFVRMHVLTKAAKFGAPFDRAGKPPGTLEKIAAGDLIRRGVVSLVLDARLSDSSNFRGAALGAIAAAFASAILPPVEVRFVVHPDSRPAIDAFTLPFASNLTVDSNEPVEVKIPQGEGRAPVVLRMPLAPVVRSRGALPLAPASIVFHDPAYDAGLSSAPARVFDRLAPDPGVPEGRGELTAVLYADRDRVNRRASITFMMDVAFEKKADGVTRLKLDEDQTIDGDIVKSDGAFDVRVAVVPKSGMRRELRIARPLQKAVSGFIPPPQPKAELATVYELPLSNVVELDGTLAALRAGDVLELQLIEPAIGTVKVDVVDVTKPAGQFIAIAKLHKDLPVERTLRVILTDEPVVEPPPALYAALVRRTEKKEEDALEPARLSLPLYAQSPLPWRVDLRDAKRDFRRGLMRRAATFVWSLVRPEAEQKRTGIHVVKVDRNGQTFLPLQSKPDVKEKFMKPRSIGTV